MGWRVGEGRGTCHGTVAFGGVLLVALAVLVVLVLVWVEMESWVVVGEGVVSCARAMAGKLRCRLSEQKR